MRFVVVRGPEPAGPFELVPGPNVLGRDASANLRLPSKRVSRRHCVAVLGDGVVRVKDLDSANGIVDEAGVRCVDLTLRPGQRVQVGDFVLRLETADVVEEELDLEVPDEPPTANDDLLLEDEDEDTPIPSGPVPVPRKLARGAPDPGRATIDRPAPPLPPPAAFPPPAAPLPPPTGFLPPPSGAPPAPAPLAATAPPPPPPRVGFPAPPAVPSVQPTLPPSLTAVPLISDQPTSETSARMPPPILPFGPPAGGFGGFTPPPPRAEVAPPAPPPAPVAPPADDATPVANPALPLAPPPPPSSPPPALPPYRDDPQTASEVGNRASTRIPPIKHAEAPRAPAGGLPWGVRMGAVVALAGAIVLCAPLGGLGAQVYATSGAAEELSLQRGEALAMALGARNTVAVAEARLVQLDASTILQSAGVRDAVVTDAAGTVLAPPERARTSIARAQVLLDAKTSHDTERVQAADGTWEIATPIRGEVTAGSGARTVVGYAWIQYDPDVASSEVVSPWLHLAAALFTLGGAAGVLVAGLWLLVLRPLRAVQEETEHAMLDHVDKVVSPVRWGALEELVHSINRAIARGRR